VAGADVVAAAAVAIEPAPTPERPFAPRSMASRDRHDSRYGRDVRHRIVIAREQYKFSCAHMTVFPDGTKERLHGHNYTVALALELDTVELAAMLPFSPIKAAIADLCQAWKERVLIAAHNPHLQIIRDDERELEFVLCGDRYVLPRGDVLLLPIDNISVEALSVHVAELLQATLTGVLAPHATALEITVEESPGQGASCTLALR
jgi:6-pyruvoyltetrahydropterin/6-carboxytetrahydropterin synthase